MAKLVRHLTLDQAILGSNPSPAAIIAVHNRVCALFTHAARSSRGLGCGILSPVTGVRIPYGLP